MAPSSSTSLSLPLVKEEEVTSNWAELPSELTSAIMLRLGVMEKLESARVCTSWLRVCRHPSMWRTIDMRTLRDIKFRFFEVMCRRAVDLSQGGLLEIKIENNGSDGLLTYIADRSSNLRSLAIIDCRSITSLGISKAVLKLPLLEELSFSYYSTKEKHLKAIGQACPNMKIMKLNCIRFMPPMSKCDDVAFSIAKTMPSLCHLELFGNSLSNMGLNAVLDNCSHLEYLDLRRCFYINLVGDLEKRCFQRIKEVRRPKDSTPDYYLCNSLRPDSDSDDDAYGSDYTVESVIRF